MIEAITDDRTGLPAILAAGLVIAADAEANIRMADAQGHSSLDKTAAGVKAYEAECESALKAWSSFKESIAREGVFSETAQEALEAAMIAIRSGLDKIG
jgi:hypothetical protein